MSERPGFSASPVPDHGILYKADSVVIEHRNDTGCRRLLALRYELADDIWNDAIRPVAANIAQTLRAQGSVPPNAASDVLHPVGIVDWPTPETPQP